MADAAYDTRFHRVLSKLSSSLLLLTTSPVPSCADPESRGRGTCKTSFRGCDSNGRDVGPAAAACGIRAGTGTCPRSKSPSLNRTPESEWNVAGLALAVWLFQDPTSTSFSACRAATLLPILVALGLGELIRDGSVITVYTCESGVAARYTIAGEYGLPDVCAAVGGVFGRERERAMAVDDVPVRVRDGHERVDGARERWYAKVCACDEGVSGWICVGEDGREAMPDSVSLNA